VRPSAAQSLVCAPGLVSDDSPIGLDGPEDHLGEGREPRGHLRPRSKTEPLALAGLAHIVPTVGAVGGVDRGIAPGQGDGDGMVDRARSHVCLGDSSGEITDAGGGQAVGVLEHAVRSRGVELAPPAC